jgi:transposase InsO family protein
LKAKDVLHWLQKAVAQHGAPEYLRSDNGPEFIAKLVQRWLKTNRIKTIYIEPGSPWQNGFVESFHGRFRDECLNREQLWTLTEALVVVGDFRKKYNEIRPHSRLGYESPAAFAARSRPFPDPGRASPSLHWEWTKKQRKPKLKPMLGLTQQWSRKLSPVSRIES